MKVYISSTLKDLQPERLAIRDVLVASGCSVKESYNASESDLRGSILEEIAGSDVYVCVLGQRYGFVPPGDTRSITEIEYDQAVARGLPRYVFVKNGVRVEDADSYTNESDPKLIAAFRQRVSSGARNEPRPAQFETVERLRSAVQTAVYEYKMRKAGRTDAVLGSREKHPWEMKYELSVACVPGNDDAFQRQFAAAAQADQRIQTFALGPGRPLDYLTALDEQVRRSRAVAIAITSASVSRFTQSAADVAAAIEIVKPRSAGVFGLLVDVAPADLPDAVRSAFSDTFLTAGAAWSDAGRGAEFDRLQQWRRARAPETIDGTRVGIPYMIIGLTAGEAAQMLASEEAVFAAFGEDADRRRTQFDALRTRLEQSAQWPGAFYGPRRDDWKPFGTNQTVTDFVEAAARKIDQAPIGSRERRLVGETRLAPLPYAFEEYLDDRAGSREHVTTVCARGCLVLLDEFALLHPTFRPAIDTLFGSNNAAVVSMSACDPTLNPLRTLLAEPSYLRIANLHARFSQAEDPGCELALNSAERLQRWLRLVLPELKGTLGSQQGDQALLRRSDELFSAAG